MKTGIHGLGHGQLVQIQSEETGDGVVKAGDLGLLFAAWGPCD